VKNRFQKFAFQIQPAALQRGPERLTAKDWAEIDDENRR
jgi:hypothetical protein